MNENTEALEINELNVVDEKEKDIFDKLDEETQTELSNNKGSE